MQQNALRAAHLYAPPSSAMSAATPRLRPAAAAPASPRSAASWGSRGAGFRRSPSPKPAASGSKSAVTAKNQQEEVARCQRYIGEMFMCESGDCSSGVAKELRQLIVIPCWG